MAGQRLDQRIVRIALQGAGDEEARLLMQRSVIADEALADAERRQERQPGAGDGAKFSRQQRAQLQRGMVKILRAKLKHVLDRRTQLLRPVILLLERVHLALGFAPHTLHAAQDHSDEFGVAL